MHATVIVYSIICQLSVAAIYKLLTNGSILTRVRVDRRSAAEFMYGRRTTLPLRLQTAVQVHIRCLLSNFHVLDHIKDEFLNKASWYINYTDLFLHSIALVSTNNSCLMEYVNKIENLVEIV